MAKIVIVTETGCDLTQEDKVRYGIVTVPMHVNFDDRSLDDGSFPVTNIFQFFEKTGHLPKTSAANPQDYRAVFEKIWQTDKDSEIIHLGYSAVTTASFNNRHIATEDRYHMTHIDTKQVSVAGRAIVLKVAEYIKSNPDATVENIKKYAESCIEKCRFSFFPGDIEYLKAGGRVSNSSYLIASVLALKPLIEIKNGHLLCTKKHRGKNEKVFPSFLDQHLDEHRYEKDSFFMCCSPGMPRETKQQLTDIAHKHGYSDFPWLQTGCVISAHAGPGAFGVGGFEYPDNSK